MSTSSTPTSTDDTVTLLVTMTFDPAHEEAFLSLAASVVAQVAANEPDALLFACTKEAQRGHTYVWIERFRNQQALDSHREAPYIVAALAQLPDWWAVPPEVIELSEVVSA